jgi:hypothetical protein
MLAAPGLACAEEIYKSTMSDGTTVYGETPQAGAKKVEKVEVHATTTGTIVATPQDKERAERIGNRSGPSVGVMPEQKRSAAPPLESGTINPPGMMPRKSY